MGIYLEDDLLPLSVLADLVFCERRAALHQIETIWEDNLFTVEGTHLHKKVDDDLPVESRGDVRISRGLMLRSFRLGLVGKTDVVEFHRLTGEAITPLVGMAAGVTLDEATGLRRPFPVEYKRGRLRREKGFEVQLCAQALCLEEMLHCPVPEGALFYGKNRRRQVVRFDDELLRRETEVAAKRLHELVRSGITPQARYAKKCESCSLINLCVPKVAGAGKSVGRYLSRMLAEEVVK
ncbi:CRISPR-associated protein Cas4 [Desulfurivibrio sp. D14AmB]|uniref:CRISPR-associated protein Cas4 n=1 Tax=Desulfurivibrio sp. D14AmB TaxID=3374370 RepID=UPI00376F1C96